MHDTPAASEPLVQRLKDLFKNPRTRWDGIVRSAFVYIAVYIIATILAALFSYFCPKRMEFILGAYYPVTQWTELTMGAVFSVALMIVSVWYGGTITDFYSKLIGFGITDVRVNRRGQDPDQTKLWISRISESKQISIVGTLSKGWFVQAQDDLDVFLKKNVDIVEKFDVYLLDPFGDMQRAMIESGTTIHEDFVEDVMQVFRNIYKLAAEHKVFKVHLYDTDPMSYVAARGAIYLGLYLPRTSRKEIPEFTISAGSFLGDKIAERVDQLKSTAANVSPTTINKYRQIMKSHADTTREAFWNDPDVTCDFCKEPEQIPSTFTRWYPQFEGSRMIDSSEHFYVTPTLGQLVPDHALLISKSHITSSADFDQIMRNELDSLFNEWSKAMESEHKIPLIFEHGIPSEDTCYGGCGISHSHLHLLPLLKAFPDIYEQVEAFLASKPYKYTKKKMDDWGHINELQGKPYLALKYEKQKPIAFVFGHNQRIESQLMRQFIALKCQGSSSAWDWRKLSNSDLAALKLSTDKLRGIFSDQQELQSRK